MFLYLTTYIDITISLVEHNSETLFTFEHSVPNLNLIANMGQFQPTEHFVSLNFPLLFVSIAFLVDIYIDVFLTN